MYMKSIVLVSPTAFMLLLVLKWRTGASVSMVAEAGRRGALVLLGAGLSEVRSEEKVEEPVMEMERVVGLVREVVLKTRRARVERRGRDMLVV
jgi:hypothetical protein